MSDVGTTSATGYPSSVRQREYAVFGDRRVLVTDNELNPPAVRPEGDT